MSERILYPKSYVYDQLGNKPRGNLYYLKYEADKVIAEKDKEIADLVEKNKRLANKDVIMASEAIKDVYKELRHQKYKRCLDKAAMCEARYDEEDAKVNGSGMSWEYISKEMKYWERWRWRWDALADQFKPDEE